MEEHFRFGSRLPDGVEDFLGHIHADQVEQAEFSSMLCDEVVGRIASLTRGDDVDTLFFQLIGVFRIIIHIGRHEGHGIAQRLQIKQDTPCGPFACGNVVFGDTVVNDEDVILVFLFWTSQIRGVPIGWDSRHPLEQPVSYAGKSLILHNAIQ